MVPGAKCSIHLGANRKRKSSPGDSKILPASRGTGEKRSGSGFRTDRRIECFLPIAKGPCGSGCPGSQHDSSEPSPGGQKGEFIDPVERDPEERIQKERPRGDEGLFRRDRDSGFRGGDSDFGENALQKGLVWPKGMGWNSPRSFQCAFVDWIKGSQEDLGIRKEFEESRDSPGVPAGVAAADRLNHGG